MEAKAFEVRDAGTFCPVVAVRCSPANEVERYLLSRLGYGRFADEQRQFVLMSRLGGGTEMHYAPHNWGDRTLQTAHEYITEHFEELTAGDVVDVRVILGERTEAAIPERIVQGPALVGFD